MNPEALHPPRGTFLTGVLGLALGVGFHAILPDSNANHAAPTAPATEIAALTQRLERIESSLEALQSTVFLAGTSEGAGAAQKLSAETLVAALRDELRRSGKEAVDAAPRVDDATVEGRPENAPALAEAERIFENARSAGRWTDEDAMSLRRSLASLSGRQATALLDRLVPALNGGEIQVETRGAPF